MPTDTLTLVPPGAVAPARGSRLLDKIARFIELVRSVEGDGGDRQGGDEVRVHVCSTVFEASYLVSVLADAGVVARLEGYGLDPYGVLFVPQRGFATLIVHEEDAPDAREVIARVTRRWREGSEP